MSRKTCSPPSDILWAVGMLWLNCRRAEFAKSIVPRRARNDHVSSCEQLRAVVAYYGLSEFVRAAADAGEVLRIAAPVDAIGELSAITQRLVAQHGAASPMLYFESVRHSAIPVVTNVLGSPQRICRALGVAQWSALAEHCVTRPDRASRSGFWTTWLGSKPSSTVEPPKTVKQAVSQQVVRLGRDIQLFDLPCPKHWPDDGWPQLQALVLVGRVDQPTWAGLLPVSVVDRQQIWIHGTVALREQWSLRSAGPQLSVAVVLGCDPATLLAFKAAEGWTELQEDVWPWVGAVRQAGIELTQARTVELTVPADAELVLEGRLDRPVSPIDDVPPRSTFRGHYLVDQECWPVTISAMTHRANPLLPVVVPGLPPHEDAWMTAAADRLQKPLLQQSVPDLLDFRTSAVEGAGEIGWICVQKRAPGHPRQVLQSVSGLPVGRRCKLLIAVDADLWNQPDQPWSSQGNSAAVSTPDLWWAVTAFADLSRDAYSIKSPRSSDDVTADASQVGGQLLIDATRKWPGEAPRVAESLRLTRSPEFLEKLNQRWLELGLP
jgi:4-hydroxy-3-polyprenylbenzoate decarboxylase